jgi:uncharacterized repeat protein (TIGR01451 family)
MIIKRNLYKIAIAIAMVLMLISTAGAVRFGDVILKTDSSTGFVDFLKFPACGCDDDFGGCGDHSCNDKSRDKDKSCDKDKKCPICPAPALNITKSASPTTYSDVGQIITYIYNVTNIGNVVLTGVVVYDNKTGTIPVPTSVIYPNQTVTVASTYKIIQSDIDDGSVINSAYAASDNTISNSISATVTAANQNPALTLTKIPNLSTYNDGQSVLYTYTVTNIGNVALSSVNVTDTTFGQAIVLGTTTLAPGASTTGTFTYTTTQTDFDNGSVVDNALAEGTFKSTVVQAPASATITANPPP